MKKSWLRSIDLSQQLRRCAEGLDPMGQDVARITDAFGCFPKRCHKNVIVMVVDGGKMRTTGEQRRTKMTRPVSSELADFFRLAPAPASSD
jgi:hypothetical protein